MLGINSKDFMIVDRPGYFGKLRNEIEDQYEKDYPILKNGHPGWQECWQVGEHILDFDEAVMLYDDAYWVHLKDNPDILQWVTSFGECYDSDPSNIACGLEHDPQATPRHIQDISVRKALVRLGIYFKQYIGSFHGFYSESQLLHIRGPKTNGFALMPGNVNFHLPNLILQERPRNMPDWIKPGSIEAFWQSNKVIIAYRN